MTDIGRHLIIDGIYAPEFHIVHSDRTSLAHYLEKVTEITGMTLVFPPIAMSFPFAGETNKLIQKLDLEGKCGDSKVFQEFKHHIQQRNTVGSGVSAVAVWVESHCTLHSWTERNYISIDLFSCSTYEIEPVIDFTIEKLGLTKANFVCVDRRMDAEPPEIINFTLECYIANKIASTIALI